MSAAPRNPEPASASADPARFIAWAWEATEQPHADAPGDQQLHVSGRMEILYLWTRSLRNLMLAVVIVVCVLSYAGHFVDEPDPAPKRIIPLTPVEEGPRHSKE